MFLALFVLLCVTALQAEIKEADKLSDVNGYVNSESLVFVNISDVLYAPGSTLADNQWRLYFTDRVHHLVNDKEAAEKLINRVKNQIVNDIPKKLVDAEAPTIVQSLQERQIPVLGITRKMPKAPYVSNFDEVTSKHLQTLGIHLEKTMAYLSKGATLSPSYSLAYGIVFTNKQAEGPAVLSFIESLDKLPKAIVMVDNSKEALESVQDALKATGIRFIGLHFDCCYERAQRFDADLGTIEFLSYVNEHKMLSDDDARVIKAKSPHQEALLDAYIQQQ